MAGAEVALAAQATIGEGPVWSVDEGALYWIDVPAGALHRLEPGSGATRSWELPAEVGCIALRAGGGAIAALRTGFCLVDLDTGAVEMLEDPEADQPRTRFNDGKCDRRGRFWAGTMDIDEQSPLGALYRFEGAGRCEQMLTGVGLSNGLGWSPDNQTMYHTDSLTRVITAYDYDLDSGLLRAPRPFVVDALPAVPDGLTVDADGCVWGVKWDGWRVVRYTPAGRVDREVALPVQQPTSCAFGGPDLDVLFVTSAREGLSEAALAEQPLAGSVFAIDAGTQGLPEPVYQG
ncbi:MAG: SMP-30/gluconolactonase/LRE family protein [Actinomycetota bacterium]|nr:SMP-30/gluconolactonase/LRE family protein [Actinomycetota bacterium]